MAGTYEFADDMCPDQGGSALCIDRHVTIEAEVAGSVVLDAKGARRVIYVSTAGRAELVGLNITGGAAYSVSFRASIEPTRVHRRLDHPVSILDLTLAARRAVASMSTEWLTLKAAISMTTPLLIMCVLAS